MAQHEKRILIVDDEPLILDAFSDFIERLGMHVDISGTLEGALHSIDTHVYDLVITDLRLTSDTSREGIAIIKHCKERNPHTTAVLWTGYGTDEIRHDVFQAGADCFFEKPVTPQKIMEVLRQLDISQSEKIECSQEGP
jgi:DNA-binding NtrC family response regulator